MNEVFFVKGSIAMQEDLNVGLDNAPTAFHFAEQSNVGLSIERLKWDFDINARGSVDPVK